MPPIDDHPLRYQLANELHARPFPTLGVPCVAAYMAIKHDGNGAQPNRQSDRSHLIALLDRYGASHPQPDATHYYGQIGKHWLKWEQHTEFVTYTVFGETLPTLAFGANEFQAFPTDWLHDLPGVIITSILLRVEETDSDDAGRAHMTTCLRDWFVPESLAVSSVLDGAAVTASDFRIDPNGHIRFAVFAAPDTGKRRVGRIVQRLCEIETYKAMSMLGFGHAQTLAPQLNDLDMRLSDLMTQMRNDTADPEDTLDALLSISSELETLSALGAYRFGATGAYEAIVNQRIAALREARFQGRQSFGEFMMRRYEPAMRTVKSAQSRLDAMSQRSIRASNLLRTRVDVERAAQNQSLLQSMDRRADLQLRLQRTVEGLSVVAISYYAVSLATYLFYPLGGAIGLSKGNLSALVTLPIVVIVWLMVRRLRKHLD